MRAAYLPSRGSRLRYLGRRSICAPSLVAMLVAGILAAFPAAACTRVSIARQQIVVSTGTARAVITRSPFRLGVADAPGRVVLGEVANTRPAPALEPPTIDPAPPGFDNPSGSPLYAPLSFTVGAQTLVQYAGGIWGGNLLSGIRSARGTRRATCSARDRWTAACG
jgi:hypothetical protein